MHNLIFAILCSVAVSVLLKVARKKNIIIEQAIAFNYIVAISLSYFLLKPDFKGLEFTEYLAQSDSTPIFLALGILLPTVFIIMSKAVEFAGIVRSDAAQRLSLFLPIVASFIIFHETLSQPKVVGIILAFIGLFCILNKSNEQSAVTFKGILGLIGVWFGYGTIDILFKQVAKSGGAFPTTLFIAFSLAACVMFLYLFLKRTQWTVPSFIGGIILGSVLGLIFAYFTGILAKHWIIVPAVIVMTLTGQIGDLIFSAIKRYFEVKDYSKLLPGHGGILDRIDSLTYNVLIFSFFLMIVGL